jgi:hypothetical protein
MSINPPSPTAKQATLGAEGEAVTIQYGTAFGAVARPNGGVAVQVTGTFSATVLLEHTLDGTNWVTLLGVNTTTGAEASSLTAPGILRAEVVGALAVRARVSAYTSGSAVVTMRAVDG